MLVHVVPCKSSAKESLFEWQHHKIPHTDVKVEVSNICPAITCVGIHG